MRNPYTSFQGRELTLNDHLAIDRTILSNERTLLAYGRTSLAMLVIGGTCLKLFESPWMRALGVPFLIGGLLLIAWGWVRFRQTRRLLSFALERQTGSPEHPLESRAKAAEKGAQEGAGDSSLGTPRA